MEKIILTFLLEMNVMTCEQYTCGTAMHYATHNNTRVTRTHPQWPPILEYQSLLLVFLDRNAEGRGT